MDMFINQTLLSQERNKVKNVLIRYCGNRKVRRDCLADRNYQHPENACLVKYFPKYYQSLTLVMKPQHSLLTKIKRIKKLKRFTGNFNYHIPQVHWFKILGSSRKEIEEFPEIDSRPSNDFFRTKTTLHLAKFFFQITRLQITAYHSWDFSHKKLFLIWEIFSKHLKNMRKLRNLKIDMDGSDYYGFLEAILKKLNIMSRLLGKLEVLKCPLICHIPRDILQNKSNCSYLEDLSDALIPSEITPICQAIPQITKYLKSLSLNFETPLESVYARLTRLPKYLDFGTPIQKLSKLQSLSIHWSGPCSCDFWSYFIPPASLRNLKVKFNALDMIMMISQYENFFDDWGEISELDAVAFQVCCKNSEEMLFTKEFITALLKKVSKLTSFTCALDLAYNGVWRYEPFEVEEVCHLYGHLKKFKVKFRLEEGLGNVGFDFAFLRPFKKLKDIDFGGYHCLWTNIGDAMCILEENAKSGEFLTLKLGEATIYYPEELKDLLRKISKMKKSGTNFKITLHLEIIIYETRQDDDIKYLNEFCEIIESKNVQGLEILLHMENEDCSRYTRGEVKRIFEKHHGAKNFMLQIFDGRNTLEYIKRDGEKEQLLFIEC